MRERGLTRAGRGCRRWRAHLREPLSANRPSMRSAHDFRERKTPHAPVAPDVRTLRRRPFLSARRPLVVGLALAVAPNASSAASFTGLGDLAGGSFSSLAFGVSADGATIVGRSRSASGNEAFLWTESDGMQELDVVLAALGVDLTGWTLREARGISDDGTTIVGYGTNPSGFTEAWIAVIPKPGTGLLVMTGLLGLSARRRRRA